MSRAEIASQNWLICHLGGKRRPTTNNFLLLLLISGVFFTLNTKEKRLTRFLGAITTANRPRHCKNKPKLILNRNVHT